MYLDFYNKLNDLNDKECIEKFITYNVSPVIAEVKPASTINFKKDGQNNYKKWCDFGEEFIRNIELEYVELREDDNSIIILIFKRDVLFKYINNSESKEFLINLGYSNQVNVDSFLNMLKHRYKLNNCPHELGIFLGIPIEDVRDFMGCTNKKCLLNGYWKVYNNCNYAKRVFMEFDDIREHVALNIIHGSNLMELIKSIRERSYLH